MTPNDAPSALSQQQLKKIGMSSEITITTPIGMLNNISRTDMAFKRLGECFDRLRQHGRQLAREFEAYEEAKAEVEALGGRFESDFDPWVLHGLSVWKTEQQRKLASKERKGGVA